MGLQHGAKVERVAARIAVDAALASTAIVPVGEGATRGADDSVEGNNAAEANATRSLPPAPTVGLGLRRGKGSGTVRACRTS